MSIALARRWSRRGPTAPSGRPVAGEHLRAAILLAALVGLLLVGAAVPQQAITPPLDYARWRQQAPLSSLLELAGFTAAAKAPWLPLVSLLLGLSLARCTARRIGALRREWRAAGLSRGWLARCGSVVFHAALLGGLAILTLSVGTRFSGHVELAPGATVVDAPGRFLAAETGWWTPSPSGLTLRVDQVRVTAWPDGTPREHAAAISLLRSGSAPVSAEVERSQPFELDDVSVLLGPRAGPAALLVVEDGRGRRGGWVHFPAWSGGEVPAELIFSPPDTGLHLQASLEAVQPERFDDAVLTLRAVGTAESRQLRPGETATYGPVRLQLVAVDAWTSLTVVRDGFVRWAFVAFGLGLVGLALAIGLPAVQGAPAAAPRPTRAARESQAHAWWQHVGA